MRVREEQNEIHEDNLKHLNVHTLKKRRRVGNKNYVLFFEHNHRSDPHRPTLDLDKVTNEKQKNSGYLENIDVKRR